MTKNLFLDLGSLDVGGWYKHPGIHERWQDLGAGLIMTIAKQHGQPFDCIALPGLHSWAEFRHMVKGYDMLAMNVRNWRMANAVKAARVAKSTNPNIKIIVGGFHTSVCLDEVEAVEDFDYIITGQADVAWGNYLDNGFPQRVMVGDVPPFGNLDDVPFIDREVFPHVQYATQTDPWPLDGYCGWGPGPRVAATLTSRGCPFTCQFCYPAARIHYKQIRRRSVRNVIDELKMIDQRWGPINSVVFHDDEFFMQPRWLEQFHEAYQRETPKWSFWGAGRADMILKFPDIFKALVLDCNWHSVSIGLESGSDRVLNILGKGTTRAINDEAIDLVNGLGDRMEAKGETPVKVFANLMLAIPGEEREEAFETLRMARRIKRVIPSFAWYTPTRGNAMGDKLRAEGKALNNIAERFPGPPKVLGVDYQFYSDLMYGGVYNQEVGFNVPQFISGQGGDGGVHEGR